MMKKALIVKMEVRNDQRTANKMIESRNILMEEGWLGCGRAAFKAQRIISGLAKVETATDLVGLIGKFRAIAEEGANHE